MYVVARREGETLVLLDGLIRITVVNVTGKIARIGVEAPRELRVEREELFDERCKRVQRPET